MKLKWALAELAKYKLEPLILDGKVNLKNSLKKRKKEIIDSSPVEIKGAVMLEGYNQYLVDLEIKVTLTLPSSRSLTPVDYELNTSLTEIYLAPGLSQNIIEELDDEIIIPLEKDIINLRKPIEDTIIASIPMKILSEEEVISDKGPSGNHWELFIEDEDLPEQSEDSSAPENNPFGVLKDLDLFEDED